MKWVDANKRLPETSEPVTYIRLPMVEVDALLGFRVVSETIGNLAKP